MQQIVSGLALGSVYALVALGFIIIYKATDVLNFAQGDMMMFSAYVNYALLVSQVLPIPLTILITVLSGAILGFLIERAIVRPMLGKPLFATVLVTMGVGICLRAVAGTIWGHQYKAVPEILSITPIKLAFGLIISPFHLTIIIVSMGLVALLSLFFNFTRLGTAMRAVARHQMAAFLMGIRVRRMFSINWMISGFVGALGGLLIGPLTFLSPDLGFIGLNAFPAAIIGGFGSVPGAVVGGLILGVSENIAGGYLPEGIKNVFPWTVLIVVLMIRPEGFFGVYEEKKV
ncbi:MAG: branched-chain amino acid ABC transporter permease [Thermodesulfobacteriota bacterium]